MSSLLLIPSANLGWSYAYRSTLWRNIIFLLSFLVTGCTSRTGLYETEGPNFFTHEPPMLNYFTHDKGLSLHCSARGSTITWMNAMTFEPISSINGLRQILLNGSIFYPPFSTTFYRPDVHNSTIYCVASNPAGQIRSRDIHIRAVINSRQEIHPQDTYVTIGNDALLNCLIPETIKDFVSATSWIKDSTFNIFPHSGGGGGRYYMLPSGSLLIEGASSNDSASTFRCRTVNRLTGKTLESETSARLRLRSGESKVKPRIVGGGSAKVTESIRLKEGETGVLLCLSEADPPASQVWQKADGFGGFENLRQSERIRIRKSTVIIENVGQHDAGLYLCICSNVHGSVRLQIYVIVQSPLTVQVLPSVMTADVGKSVEFSCWTNIPSGQKDQHSSSMLDGSNGGVVGSSSRSGEWTKIRWYKNGKELTASTRIAFSSFNKLRIAYVQREDFGMIQCFVLSPTDMSQAAAQLRLDDASPHFTYRFIEQTLQPGQPVSLKCTAAGNPTPRVKWMLDGFVPPISERVLIGQYVRTSGDVVSHLNITKVEVRDGGEYSCLLDGATSIDGTPLVHSARLNIYGPPFIRTMPPVTAIAGKTFTIKCPAAGFPLEWPIVWEKEGQLLPLSRRQTVTPDGILTIRDVDRAADFGRYSCLVHNKQGLKDQKSVQVNVVVAPKVSFNFRPSVSVGERLVVNCVVSEGDSPIQIKWLKDSHPILSSSSSSGSLDNQGTNSPRVTVTRGDFDLALRINSVTPSDAGVYTCSSSNAFGEASVSAPLVVQVPPRITPFFFPTSVQVHQRAQVVCALQEGDPYMTSLKWLKNNEPISSSSSAPGSSNKIKIIEVQRDVSLLIIDSADSEDNGNYTCTAQGDVEGLSDSVTAPLLVRVPPQWRVEPTDQMILSGDNHRIPCQAEGFPLPTISWKKQMGTRGGNYQDIPNGVNAKSLLENVVSDANGTLYIRLATKKAEGYYICEANNGIGAGLSRIITVTVNVPVKITDKAQNTTTRVRTNAVLKCRVTGDSPIEVNWRSSQLDSANLALDPRYYIQTTVNVSGGGLMSELKINNVIRDDSKNGPFTCYASNNFGKDYANFWLLVRDVPEPPRDLNLISKGSRFLRIGWSLDSSLHGNSPITQFTISYYMEKKLESWGNGMDSSSSIVEINVPGNMFSETIRNLQPATTYHISVLAQNEIGSSGASDRLDVNTDGEPPPPPIIQATPVSSSEIKITWEHKDDLPSKLLGYYVGFRRHREEDQYQFSTVDGTSVSNIYRSSSSSLGSKIKETSRHEYFLSNLIAFTTYEIVIQAFNSFGVGALSEPPVIANTLEDVPISAPEGFMCLPINSQNIKLSFQSLSPAQARGIITGYKVFLEKTNPEESDDDVIVRTTLATSTVITGLQPWTNYSVQVAGMTHAGEGVHTSPIQCQTEEDVPEKLEAIKSVTKSATSCIVSWLPPRKKNGQLSNYVLYIGEGSHNSGRNSPSGNKKKTISPMLNHYEVENLKTNEKYEFRVAAVTSKGEGKGSITHQIPTKNFGAAIVTIGQEFLVVWKADIRLPCLAVGDPTPLLEWNRASKVFEENERMIVASDGSLLIRDAQKEDQGEYSCTVKNNRGTESINHTLFVQVPPPEPLLHTTSSTHSSIFIMWKLLDYNKISLKGYILHLKVRDEWVERRLNRHMSSYEITDLECGTGVELYLTGYNSAGIGKASNILKNVTTLGNPPSVIGQPETMLQVNTTWIRVNLDSWLENGCPLIQCRILFRQHEQQTRWQTVATEINFKSREIDLVGLKPSTNYAVRVLCRNTAGENEVDMSARTLSWNDEQVGLENSKDLSNKSPMWKTAPAATTTASTAFYLDWKLMGPIVLSSLAIMMAGGGLCLCIKKKPHSMGRSMEHLSGGTPSSSTYFKGNQRNAPHPLYMTVKKATPLKGSDLANADHIPQYSEDIYPYATFELNEPNIRNSRFGAPTGGPERNRSNSTGGQNRKSSNHSGTDNFCNAKFYDERKNDESEEYDYDSIDSDSELGTCKVRPGEFFIEYREPVESKCQDFEFSHPRCTNQYEFVPSQNHLFHHRLKTTGKNKNPLQSHCEDASVTTFSVPKQKKQKNRLNSHPYGGTEKIFNSTQIEPPSSFSDVKSVTASESIAV